MADTANITLKGESEAINFIDEALRGDIAYEELSTTVSKTGGYVAGDHLIYLGQYYEVVADIAQGGTIVTSGAGQNVEEREVGDEIKKNKTQVLGVICDVETSPATAAHSAGDQFYYDGALVEATSAIAIGDTIVVSPDTGYNVKVADKVVAQIQTLTQQINDNGVKNIMPYPFVDKNGKSQYGVTSVDNGDGTVTISGTNTSSTANLIMFFWFSRNTFIQNYVGETLSVSFEGLTTAENTAYAPLTFYDTNGNEISRITFSNSNTHAEFTVTSEMKSASLRFHVYPSKTVNVTLKAMVCLKSLYDADSSWVAPTYSNVKLTQKAAGLIDNQNVNGAVNMLPINLTTQVDGIYSYTVAADKTISTVVSSTTSLTFKVISPVFTLKAGTYKLSGTPVMSGPIADLQLLYSDDSAVIATETNNQGAVFTLATDASVKLRIIWHSNVAAGTYVFKPMITVPSYNGDYVPYAMSNKELTEIVTTPFKIAKTDCYCENDTAIHTYTPTAIAGYKPIGIVGLSAINDIAAVTDLYEYRLHHSGDNLHIRLGWKTAFSTTKGVRVMILYVSETSGLSIVSE